MLCGRCLTGQTLNSKVYADGFVTILVRDIEVGIPPKIRRQNFTVLFTTKS